MRTVTGRRAGRCALAQADGQADAHWHRQAGTQMLTGTGRRAGRCALAQAGAQAYAHWHR